MNARHLITSLAISIVTVLAGCGGNNMISANPTPTPAPSAALVPTFAYVANDGGVNMYSVNSNTGAWTPLVPAFISSVSEDESLAVDPQGRFL